MVKYEKRALIRTEMQQQDVHFSDQKAKVGRKDWQQLDNEHELK